jgi:4-hydroxythreonine-4-phosphate dehydrogenase
MGDPSGIGPEVIAAALTLPTLWRGAIPLVFGDPGVLERALGARRFRRLRLESFGAGRPSAPAIVPLDAGSTSEPGKPDPAGARLQFDSIVRACNAMARGDADALCTAPVSKAQIATVEPGFVGHTEFLAERFHSTVLMLMAGPRLRVALATTHLPLSEVPRKLDRGSLAANLRLLDAELRKRFAIQSPRLAVTGLNPHAGEQGHFGREEIDVIRPAVEDAVASGVDVSGPFSADGLFPRVAQGAYDAVLAMYHDQGLIPVKLADFESAVNVTLGLPFVRTSPDHGVAYDLAGKDEADPRSTIAAVRLAIRLARGS